MHKLFSPLCGCAENVSYSHHCINKGLRRCRWPNIQANKHLLIVLSFDGHQALFFYLFYLLFIGRKTLDNSYYLVVRKMRKYVIRVHNTIETNAYIHDAHTHTHTLALYRHTLSQPFCVHPYESSCSPTRIYILYQS